MLGQVIDGLEVLDRMEKAPTGKAASSDGHGPNTAETALEWVAMHCAGAADKPVQEIKLNKVSIQANPIAR